MLVPKIWCDKVTMAFFHTLLSLGVQKKQQCVAPFSGYSQFLVNTLENVKSYDVVERTQL